MGGDRLQRVELEVRKWMVDNALEMFGEKEREEKKGS